MKNLRETLKDLAKPKPVKTKKELTAFEVEQLNLTKSLKKAAKAGVKYYVVVMPDFNRRDDLFMWLKTQDLSVEQVHPFGSQCSFLISW